MKSSLLNENSAIEIGFSCSSTLSVMLNSASTSMFFSPSTAWCGKYTPVLTVVGSRVPVGMVVGNLHIHIDATNHEDILAFASCAKSAEVDEGHVLDRRFVDFGVIDVEDLQTPLIQFVVDCRNDLAQIVLYEILDLWSRLDRQAKNRKQVRDRLSRLIHSASLMAAAKSLSSEIIVSGSPFVAVAFRTSKMNASGNWSFLIRLRTVLSCVRTRQKQLTV